VDLARFGITRINFASLNNPFPATQVMSLPDVFGSTEHVRRAVDGPAGKQVLEAFEKRAHWPCDLRFGRTLLVEGWQVYAPGAE
jgi:TRAP-type C4-dicarboxylate transport system substrate-binding protein